MSKHKSTFHSRSWLSVLYGEFVFCSYGDQSIHRCVCLHRLIASLECLEEEFIKPTGRVWSKGPGDNSLQVQSLAGYGGVAIGRVTMMMDLS